MSHDIFISFSSEDKNIADEMCQLLESRNIKCWIAHRDNRLGDWDRGILAAIDSSKAVVLLLSEVADRSDHVKAEIERAFDKKATIIPVRIENFLPVSLAYFTKKSQWFDAFPPPRDTRFAELAAKIKSDLKIGVTAAPETRAGSPCAGPGLNLDVTAATGSGKVRPMVKEVEPRHTARSLYGRKDDLDKALKKLQRHSFSLVGMSGIGKSKLISALFERITELTQKGRTPFQVCYWRSFHYDDPPNFTDFARRLYEDLTGEKNYDLDRNTVSERVQVVYELLKRESCLLVLDQFEAVVDKETGKPRDQGFAELLTLANRGLNGSKLLVTGWEVPIDATGVPFNAMPLSGISPQAGLDYFTQEVGLKKKFLHASTRNLIEQIVARVGGHPYSLEILSKDILDKENEETVRAELQRLIQDQAIWDGAFDKIHKNIAAKVINRLPAALQNILQAISIFTIPFDETAATFVSHLPNKEIFFALKELQRRGLIFKNSQNYLDIHNIVKELMFHQMSPETRLAMHQAAATYYLSKPCPSPGARKSLTEVQPLLYAVKHLLVAGKPGEAGELFLSQELDRALYNWCHFVDLMNLYAEFDKAGEILSEEMRSIFRGNLGMVYRDLGQFYDAQKYFEEALGLAENCGSKKSSCTQLVNLGDINYYLGNYDQAHGFLAKASELLSELQDKRLEGRIMGILGNMSGDAEQSESYYLQAIKICQEIPDRRYEGVWTGDLGLVYEKRGDLAKAIELFEKGRLIAAETNDDRHVGWWLAAQARAYRKLGDTNRAIDHLRRALEISERVFYKRGIMAQRQALLELCLAAGEQSEAMQVFKKINGIEDQERSGESLALEGRFFENLAEIEQNVNKKIDLYNHAVQKYSEALKLDNRMAEVYNQRGRGYRILAYSKEYGEKYLALAINDFNKAIKLNPSKDSYYMLRAGCHSQMKNFSDAVNDYQRAIELHPFNYLAILGKMESELCLRRYRDVMVTAERLKQMTLDPPHSLVEAAIVCQSLAMKGQDYEQYLSPLLTPETRLSVFTWCIEELEYFNRLLDQEADFGERAAKAKEIYQLLLSHFDDLAIYN